MSYLKECYPFEVVEYSVLQNIDHEPAFNWWEKHVLQRQDRNISKTKQRGAKKYVKMKMKLGIERPNTVQETMKIDMKNGNTLCYDAIVNEMIYIQVDFGIKEEGYTPPPGHQSIKYYMIFDVKMEDLRCKARMFAGGHMTDAPPMITHTSAVSCETMRIASTMVACNDMITKTTDIKNT